MHTHFLNAESKLIVASKNGLGFKVLSLFFSLICDFNFPEIIVTWLYS